MVFTVQNKKCYIYIKFSKEKTKLYYYIQDGSRQKFVLYNSCLCNDGGYHFGVKYQITYG